MKTISSSVLIFLVICALSTQVFSANGRTVHVPPNSLTPTAPSTLLPDVSGANKDITWIWTLRLVIRLRVLL